MKDFTGVTDNETVERGFMFAEIQNNFPYPEWKPAGYALMGAFEATFGDMRVSGKTAIEKRDVFAAAAQTQLKTCFGEKADAGIYAALVEKIRTTLQSGSSDGASANPKLGL